MLVVASPYLYMAYGMHQQSVAEEGAKRAEQLNDAEQKELNDLLSQADAAIAAQEAAFRNATSKPALDALQMGEDACPDAPSAPTAEAADSYLKYGSIDMIYFGDASYTLVSGDDTSKASAARYARADTDRIRTANQGHSATRTQLAEARDIVLGSRHGTTIFISVADQEEPNVTTSGGAGDTGSFTPGFVRGRAYVYRDDLRRITCAGDIDAQNSPTVDVTYFTTTVTGVPVAGSMAQLEAEKSGVKRDLELQVRRVLATDLHDAR